MNGILKKARDGNAKAQLETALNYVWGTNGFPINKRLARIWYKRTALNGNPEAMHNLGTMYLEGEGGKTDIREGIEWLRKSAASRKKHIYSEVAPQLLSEIYRQGHYGMEVDLSEADRWATKFKKRRRGK